MAKSIQEWITDQEAVNCSQEEFYARLVRARIELEERIGMAGDDGVDLDELDIDGTED